LRNAKCIVSTRSTRESIAPEFPCENSGDQIKPNKGIRPNKGKGGGGGLEEPRKIGNEITFSIHAKEVKTVLDG
jgi:hypothetical protein